MDSFGEIHTPKASPPSLPVPLSLPQLPQSQHQPDLELRTAQKPSFKRRKRRRQGRARGNSGWEAKLFLACGGAWLWPEKEMGKPSSSHALSVLRLSQRPAWGLQKLMGQQPSSLPFVSCQGPTLQPQYFSRLHSDTHKWRWSKPDQRKCGCGQAGQEPWALCQPWQMGLAPLHVPFLYQIPTRFCISLKKIY